MSKLVRIIKLVFLVAGGAVVLPLLILLITNPNRLNDSIISPIIIYVIALVWVVFCILEFIFTIKNAKKDLVNENMDKGKLIKADLRSRPNTMNGKYRAAQIGLDDLDLDRIKNKDVFFLETMEMKADLADKIIEEAEAQGKDTDDPKVMRDLGEKVNLAGKPLHKSEPIMTAVVVSFKFMVYYGIAVGIWGLVFKKSFLLFGFYGLIVGLLISLLSVAPVIAVQRTKEKVRDMSFGASMMWGNMAIIIGVLGLVVWIIRIIFFT